MSKLLIIFGIVFFVIIGGFIFPIFQEQKCSSDCHKNTNMNDTWVVMHGIDHYCYDMCIGGGTIFEIKWWGLIWYPNGY